MVEPVIAPRPSGIYCLLYLRSGVLAGGGSISAILRRQSASEACGPETNVPLTFVLYQPEATPSRSDSSVLTWRGERFCMGRAFCWTSDLASNGDIQERMGQELFA